MDCGKGGMVSVFVVGGIGLVVFGIELLFMGKYVSGCCVWCLLCGWCNKVWSDSIVKRGVVFVG